MQLQTWFWWEWFFTQSTFMWGFTCIQVYIQIFLRKTHWHRWHWGIPGFFFLWSSMCFCNALNVLNVQLHSPHITLDIPIHALSCSSWLCSFLNILPVFPTWQIQRWFFHIFLTSMHCKIPPISNNMITLYTLINSLMNSMHLFYPPQPNNTFCFLIFYNSLSRFTSCCKILPTNNFHNIYISSFWCADIVEEAPYKYITPPLNVIWPSLLDHESFSGNPIVS